MYPLPACKNDSSDSHRDYPEDPKESTNAKTWLWIGWVSEIKELGPKNGGDGSDGEEEQRYDGNCLHAAATAGNELAVCLVDEICMLENVVRNNCLQADNTKENEGRSKERIGNMWGKRGNGNSRDLRRDLPGKEWNKPHQVNDVSHPLFNTLQTQLNALKQALSIAQAFIRS